MAEQLYGLGANDIPRVKRLLDAFENGQLNTPDTPGRRRFQSPVPFEFGYLSTLQSNSTALPNSTFNTFIHSTTGQVSTSTGAQVVAKNLTADRIGVTNVAGAGPQKVSLHRHQRSGKLYFQRVPSERIFSKANGFTFNTTVDDGELVPLSQSTALGTHGTTGFTISTTSGGTLLTQVTIADAGIYTFDWGVSARPAASTQDSRLGMAFTLRRVGGTDIGTQTWVAMESAVATTGGGGFFFPNVSGVSQTKVEATTPNTAIELAYNQVNVGGVDGRVHLQSSYLTITGKVYV